MQVYNQTTQYIQMDNGAKIHPQANISGVVTIGDNSRIDAFVTITGNVRIGRNVHISTGACIFGGEGVDIGDYSAISVGVKIFTATEDLSGAAMTNPTIGAAYRDTFVAPIRIGKHCVVSAGAVLLPGAELLDGACVGALSLVKEKLDGWAIYAGIPAKMIKARSKNLLNLQKQYERNDK